MRNVYREKPEWLACTYMNKMFNLTSNQRNANSNNKIFLYTSHKLKKI